MNVVEGEKYARSEMLYPEKKERSWLLMYADLHGGLTYRKRLYLQPMQPKKRAAAKRTEIGIVSG